MSQKKTKSAQQAPFTDAAGAAPHYEDIIPDKTVRPAMAGSVRQAANTTAKSKQLDDYRAPEKGMGLTTNHGVKIAHNQNTLKAGERGPTLYEDFHFHEKLSHFDRERIPERVVHARGSGAHGYFQVYKPLDKYTKAAFLNDTKVKTPVFVRFSTVQGFRGSPDTVRDIRGFAVKLYTSEGNFDIVGNHTPVFFIQDAIKFPDFVHAVKPEPQNEVPQGQSAHDSFWDYVSLQPETLHNVMWAMSDRGIPRSLRTIEGFGIHTYRLVNAKGPAHYVRFHWKPAYGKASLLWDEAHLLTGRDPDYHRKDLWNAIEAGDYPEWELGLQIIPEKDENKFGFDIMDATKLIPEALVPVQIVGKMVLDRNPDNFFAETEQVAFCPANIVPGVDFSDDPLLHGRVFSYKDTQMHRLGGPNFTEIPINRPVCPVRNHQRDGFHRMQIEQGANYEPNTLSGNWPRESAPAAKGGGFETYAEKLDGPKIRRRSASFGDYYSQPRLFWLSQLPFEQQHIIGAISFELGHVSRRYIHERVLDHLCRIDQGLARAVAANLGLKLSKEQLGYKMPKDVGGLKKGDPALSLYASGKQVIRGRTVSVLVADCVSGKSVEAVQKALDKEGVHFVILAPRMGAIKTAEGGELEAGGTIEGNASALFDAVIVPDGKASASALARDGNAKYHLLQAYKHLKALAFIGEAGSVAAAAGLPGDKSDAGLLSGSGQSVLKAFIEAMKQHRIWAREEKTKEIGA